MLSGYAMIAGLGLAWWLIGMVVVLARKEGLPIFSFYFIGSLFAALAGILFCGPARLSSLFSGDEGLRLGVCLGGVALFNSLGQALSMYNLQAGGKSLVYALPQASFLAPVLFSALALNEGLGSWKLLGLLGIASSIALLGSGSRGEAASDSVSIKRLLICLGSLALCGTGQVFMLLGGKSNALAQSPSLFSACVLAASSIVYGILSGLWFKPSMKLLVFAALWGALAWLSFSLLFIAIKTMSMFRCEGLVFAAASGINIAAFAVFSRLWFKERLGVKSICALALIVLGIAAMRRG